MKISIVMPVYNNESFIKKSISSVISQNYDNWELIIVNDGSKDNTEKICTEYSLKDRRIKVITIENSGPSIARNIGIDNSSGDYIMFIDGDDYIESNTLEILVEELKENEYEIVFFANYLDIYEEGIYNEKHNNIIQSRIINSNDEFKQIYSELLDNYYINQVWNKVYKKEFINSVGSRFPKGINYSEDLIFNIELYKKVNKVKILDKALYHYVNHKGDSLCSTFQKDKFYYVKFVYEVVMKEIHEWNPKLENKYRNIFITDINITINSLFNKDCRLTLNEKKKYIFNIANDSVVRECISNVRIIGIRNRITSLLLKMKLYSYLLLMGKTIRILKSI